MKNRSKSGSRALFLALLLFSMLVPRAMAQANIAGQWSTLPDLMPINPIHVALLPNGKVLIVAGSGNCPPSQSGCPTGAPYGPFNDSGAALYDPLAGTFNQFALSWDMFCNGMVLLSDGRAFIDGGNLQYDPFQGLSKASIFDPATNIFTDTQNMAHGRWYPTVTTLGDGRVMTFSGLNENGSTNTAVEFYTVGSGWSPQHAANWTPPLYPRMHLLPNGKVFYSGPGNSSALFDPGPATWTLNVAKTRYCCTRTYGTSVLLPLMPVNNYDPKVMIMGGNNPATATTEIIDLGALTPTWQFGPSMSQPRIEMNAVMLPNGKVLAVGGSKNDEDTTTLSLNADLYNPVTNTFASAGANAFERLYHSVALLLPDATVWLAGGNPVRGTYEPHMEIYQPAYLFQPNGTAAIRPSISSAPSLITWGNQFTVQTPDAANIASVVLVRNGTVTHAFGMDQRLVGMSFAAGSGVLTVTAPPNGNVAPPGYYMLFLLNNSGVPSVARFVQVLGGQPDFALSASPSTQSIAVGGSTSYTVNVLPQNGFNGAVTFSVSGLPTGAAATFNPTTVSGSGATTLTVTTGSTTPLGSSTLTITGSSGSLSHQSTVTLTVRTTGTLSSALATPAGTQNLTSLGTVDWTHWGLTSAGSFDHKAGVTPQISNFTVVGTGPANQYTDNAFGYSWTDGTPTASAANSTTGVYVLGVNNGFRITAPADTTPRTLTVYVDAFHAQGKLVAHLSDGSTADYVDSTLNSVTTAVQGAYTFTYQAASSGQTLSVTFTNIKSNGTSSNVALEAATLTGSVASPDFSLTATPGAQSVAAGGSTSYTVNVLPQNGFNGAVTFSVSGLPTGAAASFNPTTVSGSGATTLTVTTGGTTPLGSSTLTITGSSGSLSHQSTVTLTVGTSGALSGALATPAGPQDLTSLGTVDWAHWGLTSAGSFDHKAGVTPQISNFTVVGTGPANQYTDNAFGYSWTDGTPTASAANSTTGVYVLGVNNGFRITAPADTTPRTLTVYVDAFHAQGKLVAHLSDGSTADYVDSTLNSVTTAVQGAYTFTYQAASGGQTLSVTFTNIKSNGTSSNVALEAATLTGSVASPDFSLTATPGAQSVAAGGSTSYTVNVLPQNGFNGAVTFSVSGLPTGAAASFNPTTVSGSGATTLTVTTGGTTPLGSSTLTITGSSGSLSHQSTVTLTVGTSGALSGALATPAGPQDLTSLGTVDWAHWGLTSAGSFDHKAGVTPQISNFTVVGTGPANQYTDNAFGYSWTDGTPTASAANSTTGVYVLGVNNGFRITAPADTTPRTLTVYVDAFHAQGKLVAHLSDGSTADYVDSTLNSVTTAVQGAYTFTYTAASSGQTLSVTFTNIKSNGTSSNVALEAATLH